MDRNKPCFAFRDGKCKFGKKCKFSHDHAASASKGTSPRGPQPACRNFRLGRCRYGSACNFSHDDDAPGLDSTSLRDLENWKNSTVKALPTGFALGQFFDTALRLASIDTSTRQEVITELADDPGLAKVYQLVKQDFTTMTDKTLVPLFKSQILPFFDLISDERILASFVLEKRVALIYGRIFGIHGHEPGHLFTGVVRALSALAPHGKGTGDVLAAKHLAHGLRASSAVLLNILKYNSDAKIQPYFEQHAESLGALITPGGGDSLDVDMLAEATQYLEKVYQRLEVGKNIPNLQIKALAIENVRKAAFVMKRDGPGRLANGQRRHDNDFEDIQNIRILPTAEELQSPHIEYLPFLDHDTWHKGGVEGLLDRHFRLLREDTVGQLRDSAKLELSALRAATQLGSNQTLAKNDAIRTNTYQNARVEHPQVNGPRGLEFLISFDQPQHLQIMPKERRQAWWELSKRLGGDALVCLLSSSGVVVFCSISHPRKYSSRQRWQDDSDGESEDEFDPQIEYRLHLNQKRAYVLAHPVETNETSVREIFRTFSSRDYVGGRSLVEFPGVLLPAFQPTLSAMQSLSQGLDLPFPSLIVPAIRAEGSVKVPLPRYAQRQGFRLNLRAICQGSQDLLFDPTDLKSSDVEALKGASTLDDSQASALLHSLTRSLALIQGPPGTGKSYTGISLLKVLLDNKSKSKLGPILCVCYTNHALDQLLEHLLDEGIEQIVRMGSSSKSVRLAPLNLRALSEEAGKTKMELGDQKNLLHGVWVKSEEMTGRAKEMHNASSPAAIQSYLRENDRFHHDELFGNVLDDGYSLVENDDPALIMKRWLSSGHNRRDRPDRDLNELSDASIHSMSNPERRLLYEDWVRSNVEEALPIYLRKLKTFNIRKAELDHVRGEVNLRVLNDANIIGVTTSGLARNIGLLQRLPSKVMLCEEAGEVLESHLLTALLPHLEHAILIGDHQQLRPQIANYGLSVDSLEGAQYALDMSLFERLCRDSGLPFSHLDTQRRMHPLISELVRSTQYPSLVDGTPEYPEVVGMKKRLFWFDHRQAEDSKDVKGAINTSRTNTFEVDMTAALVSHLVKQGKYHTGDIAVLTPYLGQLTKLRERMETSFAIVLGERDVADLKLAGSSEGPGTENRTLDVQQKSSPVAAKSNLAQALRIATVDNFQGEEAKVVVISLVRSNDKQQCGFLKTPNRINVLLSRAQHGMYIIGDASTSIHVPMWSDVMGILDAGGNIGSKLEIQCPRHPDTVFEVRKPEDFHLHAPNGGCSMICDRQLACGHACRENCHSEPLHDNVKCLQPCKRQKAGCSHNCKKLCHEKCDTKCKTVVENIHTEIPCEFRHIKTELPCYLHQHPELYRCVEEVQRKLACGHVVSLECSTSIDTYACVQQCGTILPCGHKCLKSCYLCKTRKHGQIISEDHKTCTQACGKPYTGCSHSCKKACHGDQPCELCPNACAVQCTHSKCPKKCSEPCIPCAEDECSSGCPYSQCSMPCAAPCDWVPCSLRCEKMMSCGHQCPSVCGAECPNEAMCQICCSEETKNRTVDLIVLGTYEDVDLAETPCIFPSCGHFYTMDTMDGHVGMSEHYEVNENGLPSALKIPNDSLDIEKIKIVCPDCRRSLRDIPRYGRIVRRALLIESTLKFITWSNTTYVPLAQQLFALQTTLKATPKPAEFSPNWSMRLSGSRDDQISVISRIPTGKRYNGLVFLRTAVKEFANKVRVSEQPFKRVQELVNYARSNNQTDQEFSFDPSVLQTRGTVLAETLLLRCEIIILTDYMAMRASIPSELDLEMLVNLAVARADCDALITAAKQGNHVMQEVEATLFWAHFAALEVYWATRPKQKFTDAHLNLRNRANEYLQTARDAITQNPGSTRAIPAAEIEKIDKMLRGSTFYSPITDDEMRKVVSAMAREFQGTGHWYRCANGHPFTIGGCGGPMQETSCPQCGAPVGGRSHRAAEGVTHAMDLERRFGGLGL